MSSRAGAASSSHAHHGRSRMPQPFTLSTEARPAYSATSSARTITASVRASFIARRTLALRSAPVASAIAGASSTGLLTFRGTMAPRTAPVVIRIG
jgi:hypothetical protein